MIELAFTVILWCIAALIFVSAAIPVLMICVVVIGWVVMGVIFLSIWVYERLQALFR